MAISIASLSVSREAQERANLWDESLGIAYCARMTRAMAMHVSYPFEWVDQTTVDNCFAQGHEEGLDEGKMRDIMYRSLGEFSKPPAYQNYDPRTFRKSE